MNNRTDRLSNSSNLKKTISALAGAGLFCTALTGCGSSAEGKPAPVATEVGKNLDSSPSSTSFDPKITPSAGSSPDKVPDSTNPTEITPSSAQSPTSENSSHYPPGITTDEEKRRYDELYGNLTEGNKARQESVRRFFSMSAEAWRNLTNEGQAKLVADLHEEAVYSGEIVGGDGCGSGEWGEQTLNGTIDPEASSARQILALVNSYLATGFSVSSNEEVNTRGDKLNREFLEEKYFNFIFPDFNKENRSRLTNTIKGLVDKGETTKVVCRPVEQARDISTRKDGDGYTLRTIVFQDENPSLRGYHGIDVRLIRIAGGKTVPQITRVFHPVTGETDTLGNRT